MKIDRTNFDSERYTETSHGEKCSIVSEGVTNTSYNNHRHMFTVNGLNKTINKKS